MKSFPKFCIAFLIPFIFISFYACEDNPGETPGPPVETEKTIAELRGEMILHLANNIIIPSYQNLQGSTNALLTAVEGFTASPDKNRLATVQQALKTARLEWQAASIYLFGPAEGQSLQSSLSTYPTDTDKIESNIASGNYILGTLGNQAAVGFPAMDYLLHSLSETETVDAFSTGDQATGRQTYLKDLAVEIKHKVDATVDGWNSSFLATYTSEDAAGTDVGSALGLLVNAMDLHFQRFVRDGKVGIPAGVRSAGIPRPKTVESLYGGYSVELLVKSLQAYQKLFKGIDFNEVDGTSLYDYLIKIEAENLAEDMLAQYSASITIAGTLNQPLGEQINDDVEKMNSVFIELQKLVVLLKADMASLMGISITNQDNDGD